jgi:hypothetical protein
MTLVGVAALGWALSDGPNWILAGFAGAGAGTGAALWVRFRWAPEIHVAYLAGVGACAVWMLILGNHSFVLAVIGWYTVYAIFTEYRTMRRGVRGKRERGAKTPTR